MSETIKGLLDTMVSATESITRSNNADMTSVAEKVANAASATAPNANTSATTKTTRKRKQRSNKGGKHQSRRKKALSPVAEE
jgi:hypothetical protein